MVNHPNMPKPWWQVGLSVLPGVLFLTRQVVRLMDPLDNVLRYLMLAVTILLGVLSVLQATIKRDVFKVPVWGLIPLGLLAGLGLLYLSDPFRFNLTILLLVFASLVFARYNGLGAGLFVLAGGLVAASWAVEPDMYFWDSPFWASFVNSGATFLFMILSPVWALRSRTMPGQAVGLVTPVAIYAIGFIVALNDARGISIARSISTTRPFIIMILSLIIAVPVYGWISKRSFRIGGNWLETST